MENHLYRVAAEALENIVRHAHARQVTVTLRVSPHEVGMQITDDGQGFAPQAVDGRAHFGLRGLYERAAWKQHKATASPLLELSAEEAGAIAWFIRHWLGNEALVPGDDLPNVEFDF